MGLLLGALIARVAPQGDEVVGGLASFSLGSFGSLPERCG